MEDTTLLYAASAVETANQFFNHPLGQFVQAVLGLVGIIIVVVALFKAFKNFIGGNISKAIGAIAIAIIGAAILFSANRLPAIVDWVARWIGQIIDLVLAIN